VGVRGAVRGADAGGVGADPINSSVIATALVAIAAALHVPVGQTSILISSLYLTSAIAQPTAGRLAEQFGPRRVFLAGILIVLAGGDRGRRRGEPGNPGRVPGAHRAGHLSRLALGDAADPPPRRRGRVTAPPANVLGALAIAGAATIAIGPTIGGLLVGWFTWRAAFLINVPVSLAALVMALAGIPATPTRCGSAPPGKSPRASTWRA
jgi:MFS family permease